MSETEKKYDKLLRKMAKNIKNARLNRHLRQSDLIEFGFSERYVQKLESGKYSPNLYTVHRIAEALETSITEILK